MADSQSVQKSESKSLLQPVFITLLLLFTAAGRLKPGQQLPETGPDEVHHLPNLPLPPQARQHLGWPGS